MTEQAAASTSKKAYNIPMTVTSVETRTNTAGSDYLFAKVDATIRGEKRTRTLIAQGKAADAVRDALVPGQDTKIRVLFEAVTNDNGEEGGQFLVAVGMPLPPKAA